MKLTFKQKRLTREKFHKKCGDTAEMISMRSLKPKGYDKPGDASIRIKYTIPGSSRIKTFYTKISFL